MSDIAVLAVAVVLESMMMIVVVVVVEVVEAVVVGQTAEIFIKIQKKGQESSVPEFRG